MSKEEFLQRYRAELDNSQFPWVKDSAKLERFMDSVRRTIYTQAATWNHDGELARAAFRAMGGKGKMTLKALRALPERQ